METTHRQAAASVLIVDDDRMVQQSLRSLLRSGGLANVEACLDAREVLGRLDGGAFSVVLLDLGMPHMSGQELLPAIRESHPDVPVVVITGNQDISMAVRCMQLGAADYVVKPIERSRLLAAVRRCLEVQELRKENDALRGRLVGRTLAHPQAFAGFITADPTTISTLMYVETIAESSHPVLITGETGVGKDVIAGIIHKLSARGGEFVSVNVAGLDDTVFSDTLFGHHKGAFTGAESDRAGLVRRAGAGTLFLDEIGDLNLQSQIKLLRLLESGEYYPLGTDVALRTSARVVAATNIDIDSAATDKHFRRDLLYRLKTHHVHLPPLRERVGDVRLLAEHFVAQTARERGHKPPAVEEKALDALGLYAFPGNVRELRALIVDAMSRCRSESLSLSDLRLPEGSGASIASESVLVQFGRALPTMKQVLDRLVDAALERSGGNQSVAARLIGVTPQAISGRLRRRRSG